jgi:ribosome maturation factor RimP
MSLDKKIEDLVAPIVKAMGYDLWGVELHKNGKRSLVRIYIDVPLDDKRKSVNADDCSRVSKQIGALFDVENTISGAYNLEVSSPGVDRTLFKEEHYQRYIGNLVDVRLQQPKNGQRNFTGKIQAVFDNKLEIIVDDEVVSFELANINDAKLNMFLDS